MPEVVITPNQDAIVCEIDIAAPPERVFRALTDSGELTLWFTGSECPVKSWQMDARKGGRYRYATQKGTVVVNGVSEFRCEGEIVEYDPPRFLAYTWIANWHDDRQRVTTVSWELAPTRSGTHVKVTHSGLSAEKTAREDYQGGWPGVLENLQKFVEKQ